MAIRTVALFACALALAGASTFSSAAGGRSACRGVSDGILCMTLPRGSSQAICAGHVGGDSAAYLLAGNYGFQYRRCEEAGPSLPPPGKVLVTIGDFPTVGNWGRWPRVSKLRLPRRARRVAVWRVRFLGRAVSVGVHFGARPTARSRALVNTRLASVRRVTP